MLKINELFQSQTDEVARLFPSETVNTDLFGARSRDFRDNFRNNDVTMSELVERNRAGGERRNSARAIERHGERARRTSGAST